MEAGLARCPREPTPAAHVVPSAGPGQKLPLCPLSVPGEPFLAKGQLVAPEEDGDVLGWGVRILGLSFLHCFLQARLAPM